MTKPLSKAELKELETATPVGMSRNDKLERWAKLIEEARFVTGCHNLENFPQYTRDAARWAYSPMAIAAADPVFKEAGLKGDTVKDARLFFEVTDEMVHAFTCFCGGLIDNKEMASRIRGFKTL